MRRSINRNLDQASALHHTLTEFWRRDIRTVHLHVDADSPTGALRLYEKVGMQVTRQTDVYQKVIKPASAERCNTQ